MLWLPKWLNKWQEESEDGVVVDPSRRAFLGGMVATGVVLAAPKLFSFPSDIVSLSYRDMRIPLQLRPGGAFGEAQIISLELERVRKVLPTLWERDDVMFDKLVGGVGKRYGLRKQKRKKEAVAPETDRFRIQRNGRDHPAGRDPVGRRPVFQGPNGSKCRSPGGVSPASPYQGLEGLYGDDCWT